MCILAVVICSHIIPYEQSACAVHAGLSGGPLVAKDGTFVGIVACNARYCFNINISLFNIQMKRHLSKISASRKFKEVSYCCLCVNLLTICKLV